jgi:hypothetical protein
LCQCGSGQGDGQNRCRQNLLHHEKSPLVNR